MLTETNSPFTATQAAALSQLLAEMTPAQGTWLSGYLAGFAAAAGQAPAPGGAVAAAGPTPAAAAPRVAIVYATETGNSRRLAAQLAAQVGACGWQATVHHAVEYPPRRLEQERQALFLISTHGEGDPPEASKPFFRALVDRRPLQLSRLRYAVLGLGDASYRRFCQAARDLDERLAALGAQRLLPRQDCDVDYAATAAAWITGVALALGPAHSAAAVASGTAGTHALPASTYDRERPFAAEVLDTTLLTDIGSTKVTHHVELSLADSGFAYEPGDALGVYPTNAPDDVNAVLSRLGLDPHHPVSLRPGEEHALGEALTRHLEINRLTPLLVAQYASFAGDGLAALTAPDQEAQLWAYLEGRGLSDLLADFAPARPLSAQDLAGLLRRLPPRFYSVASSLRACPDEVHLTITEAWVQTHAGPRLGAFSRQCAEGLALGARLPVFVQANPDFHLPADPGVALVMIGAGSGVAPYRGFLQDRAETGAAGPTWLFFGERHSRTDFLYQLEWQQHLRQGTLSRMDVAFSRDSDRKVYVQDCLQARAAELFTWLEDGACVYVCGDQRRLAPAVHAALAAVVQSQGHRSDEQALAYLDELSAAGRYRRDVY
jgi:sulfite reductase (NADPH) flavoprotein alpha-component